ncbi:MAG: RNA polymerase Rpb4 family protein, partial [Candidatus Micrarchaeia archaeon]
MIGKRIVASKDVTLAEISGILGRISEEELGFEQSKTLEYSRKFAKLTSDEADSMVKDLMQNDKITRSNAVKIVDLMPQTPEEVRAIFSRETFVLSDDEISKIIDTVKNYLKSSKKGKEEKE